MDNSWIVHGQSMDSPETVRGEFMESPWAAHGLSMNVQGKSMDCTWTSNQVQARLTTPNYVKPRQTTVGRRITLLDAFSALKRANITETSFQNGFQRGGPAPRPQEGPGQEAAGAADPKVRHRDLACHRKVAGATKQPQAWDAC